MRLSVCLSVGRPVHWRGHASLAGRPAITRFMSVRHANQSSIISIHHRYAASAMQKWSHSTLLQRLNDVWTIIFYYHYQVLQRQNRLNVGTDKPKIKVKMQSVSDDDDQKRPLVLSWRRKMYSDWKDVTSSSRAFQVFGSAFSNLESTATNS